VKDLKAVLFNPYLLGAQGFIAGALLLWAAPPVAQPAGIEAPTAAVQMVPPAS
jgi:hypothetical protein